NLSAAGSEGPTWYNTAREEKKILIVAISSDRGLCGGFNSSIFKAVVRLIDEKYADQHKQKNVTILPIGKKASEFFTKRNFSVINDFALIYQDLSFEKVAEAAQFMMDGFRKGDYDKIEIVYNEFKNVATQILRTEQFLPVLPPTKEKKTEEVDYIYQPNQEEIITGLIPKSLKVQLFKSVLDSNAAENGARMTAMDKATENAGELLKDLRLTYNRTRQAAITKEILEIVAGAEALKSA
ncbi:MAG TPA: ATP synthase F1 subunit gamma, partial [Cytophagales bacterium]|nr:ATP synthase F1 subunit gamma [Cytophagales bacterium]